VRDARRRSLGQNFLADPQAIARLVAAVSILPGELVVEPGAGTGAITLPVATAGARVIAYEADPVWARRLIEASRVHDLQDRVQVVTGDFLRARLPDEPFRVIGNPPFRLTTALLAHLLDLPERGPWRADLVVQREVAAKRTTIPPTSLRSAAWAPWWEFGLGMAIPRRAFRPVPGVDAAMLTIRRRDPPILPHRLAPEMRDLLRRGWQSPPAAT